MRYRNDGWNINNDRSGTILKKRNTHTHTHSHTHTHKKREREREGDIFYFSQKNEIWSQTMQRYAIIVSLWVPVK